MFKLIDRYLIREIISPFFIGLLVYTFVLLMNHILLLAELFITQNVPLGTIGKLLVYLLPSIFAFTLPMSVLMGILAGMSRLSSDYEIIAFRSAGTSLNRLLQPILVFAFLCSLVTAYLTLYMSPRYNHKFVQTFQQNIISKIQFNIKPREFYESIPNMVLYIQDITPSGQWNNILVNFPDPQKPRFILARRGNLEINPDTQQATVHLIEGMVHSYSLDDPEEYGLTTFSYFEEKIDVENLFIDIHRQKRVREKTIGELFSSLRKMPRESVLRNSHLIEIHKKFALPFACLIFALIGLPLGITTKKGGKTTGFIISIIIIFIYYILITAGENMAYQGKISPFLSMWGANILIGFFGLILFFFSLKESHLPIKFLSKHIFKPGPSEGALKKKTKNAKKIPSRLRFPNILDRYITKKYLTIALLIFFSVISIFVIITYFERIDNIREHNKPVILLLQYIWFFLPKIIYLVLPITALIATLLTFGLLTKSNEVIAMKSSGISLYRLIIPVLIMALFFSCISLFLQEQILPFSNKRAEEIWDKINDVPARTYRYLDRRWVFGKQNQIYHYRYFNPQTKSFDHLSIFEINQKAWTLKKRVYAEKGVIKKRYLLLTGAWLREFRQGRPINFTTKSQLKFPMGETAQYFIQDWIAPDQMNFLELKRYIEELGKRGLETVNLKVDLHYKLSFPLVSLIITLIAIPFSFSMGKKGALYGVGLGVALTIIYWTVIGAFKSLGYINFLPPFLAAWGPNLLFGLGGIYLLFTVKT